MRTNHSVGHLILVCSSLLLFPGLTACGGGGGGGPLPTRYVVTDLGADRAPRAINTSGQVVGQSENRHAFLWSNGTLIDLGTLGGDASAAYAINDAGQIAGSSEMIPGNHQVVRAFRRQNGTKTDLGVLPGHAASEAIGINASGQVVGYSSPAAGDVRPFIWQNGAMTELAGMTGLTGYAAAISSVGHVVGVFQFGGGQHAFLWRSGSMAELGTLPGNTDSAATAVNASDAVVGQSLGGTAQARAFIWKDAELRSIGVLPGTVSGQTAYSGAEAINGYGVVVGYAGPFAVGQGGTDTHAFVYTDGTMKDLNALIPSGSGWRLSEAHGINDRGQIVGTGTYNGHSHGFVLTPQ